MGDIFTEILKLIIILVFGFSIIFTGGFIYGLNKKLGITVGITFLSLLGVILIWAVYMIMTTNTASGDFSWGSAIGGFITGQIAFSSYKSGIASAKTIKENWKN